MWLLQSRDRTNAMFVRLAHRFCLNNLAIEIRGQPSQSSISLKRNAEFQRQHYDDTSEDQAVVAARDPTL